MKKKIVWLVVSCLMVAALVLASCGPVEEEEEEVTPPPVEEEEVVPPEEEEEEEPGKEMVKIKAEKADGTVVEKWIEEPIYGGAFSWISAVAPTEFDESFSLSTSSWTLHLTNEELWSGDWRRGPAGTGEVTHLYSLFPALELMAGELAESFEMPDPDTLVYRIRKGIHFHNKPPANVS